MGGVRGIVGSRSSSTSSESQLGGARASIGFVAPMSSPEPGGGPVPERCCSQSAACTVKYGRRSDMQGSGESRAGRASTMSEHWCGEGVSTTMLSPMSMYCHRVQHTLPSSQSGCAARTSRSALIGSDDDEAAAVAGGTAVAAAAAALAAAAAAAGALAARHGNA